MYFTSVPDFPLGKKEVRWLLVLRGLGGFVGIYGFYCKSLNDIPREQLPLT
jgi:hypothetical protein